MPRSPGSARSATTAAPRSPRSACPGKILDTGVWAALAQGRIQPLDLLTSRFARVLVRVFDGRGAVEEFARSVPHDSKIRDVLKAYGIDGANLTIEARPLPRLSAQDVSDLKVFPGMVIEVRPDRPHP